MTCTTKCISLGGYQGPHCGGWNKYRNWLLKWCPPWKTTWGGKRANHYEVWRILVQQMSSLPGTNPQEGEEGHFHQERPSWGEGNPSESPSYHSCLGEDGEAEPVHHLRPAGCLCPLSKSWLPKKKILGMKQEVLQGLAREEPSPVGSRIWGGQRGQTTSPGFWPGATTRVRTRGQPFPPRVCWQLRGRRQKQVLPRTPSRRVWQMDDLGSMGAQNAWLVAGASWDSWHGWPPGASPEGAGLLQAFLVD